MRRGSFSPPVGIFAAAYFARFVTFLPSYGETQPRPRAPFPGFEGRAGKGPGIGRSHDHQTPRICGCTKLAYDRIRSHTMNKTSEMAGRPEFLSVLRRVGFSLRTLSNGNFPSLNLKPLQVKCFESILKGQDVFGVLPTGFGKSMLFHGCTVLATIKNN